MITPCNHNWGYHTLGGFPGHEHTHITGGLVCLKCGITLDEYIVSIIQSIKEEIENKECPDTPSCKLSRRENKFFLIGCVRTYQQHLKIIKNKIKEFK